MLARSRAEAARSWIRGAGSLGLPNLSEVVTVVVERRQVLVLGFEHDVEAVEEAQLGEARVVLHALDARAEVRPVQDPADVGPEEALLSGGGTC